MVQKGGQRKRNADDLTRVLASGAIRSPPSNRCSHVSPLTTQPGGLSCPVANKQTVPITLREMGKERERERELKKEQSNG